MQVGQGCRWAREAGGPGRQVGQGGRWAREAPSWIGVLRCSASARERGRDIGRAHRVRHEI